MTTLLHQLDRTVDIRATPATVFRFFTDSARWASWWGEGSTIDPRPGGRVLIRYPGGVEVAGEVVEIDDPRRLVFSYGFVSGTPIPPGSSMVTIALAPTAAGTRLRLTHAFADQPVRDDHVQGWRYQLAVFSNVVSSEVTAGATAAVDAWFGAWADTDAERRTRLLETIAVPGVQFRDRFGLTDGMADLVPHMSAAQRFMPGIRLQRRGAVRQCQGMAIADWAAVTPDGQERATGTSVFALDAGGRIETVTGFWS